MITIEKHRNIPSYLQLKHILKQELLAKPSLQQLPPEKELAETHSVSYMTVRRAVGELVEEGILTRQAGKGTFVNKPGKVKNKTYNIGFLILSEDFDGHITEYFSKLMSGMFGVMQECNYHLQHILDPAYFLLDNSEEWIKQPRAKVDGLIIYGPNDREQLNKLTRFTTSVVLDSDLESSAPTLNINDRPGFTSIMEHLIELGHTRIAHVTGILSTPSAKLRLGTYINMLEIHNISSDEDLVIEGNYSFQGGYQCTAELMASDNPPTAIAYANDLMASGGSRWLHENGYTIGKDISITGYDDLAASYFNYPPITTAHAPVQQLGAQAASTIINIIETGKPGDEDTNISSYLMPRQSTGPAPF